MYTCYRFGLSLLVMMLDQWAILIESQIHVCNDLFEKWGWDTGTVRFKVGGSWKLASGQYIWRCLYR